MDVQDQITAAIEEAMSEQRPFWGLVIVYGQREWIAIGGMVPDGLVD